MDLTSSIWYQYNLLDSVHDSISVFHLRVVFLSSTLSKIHIHSNRDAQRHQRCHLICFSVCTCRTGLELFSIQNICNLGLGSQEGVTLPFQHQILHVFVIQDRSIKAIAISSIKVAWCTRHNQKVLRISNIKHSLPFSSWSFFFLTGLKRNPFTQEDLQCFLWF